MQQRTSLCRPEAHRRRSSLWLFTAVYALMTFACGSVDAQNASYSDASSERQRAQEAAAARQRQQVEQAKRDADRSNSPAQGSVSPRATEDIQRNPGAGQSTSGGGLPVAFPRGVPIATLVPSYLATLRSATGDCEQFARLARDPNSDQLVTYEPHERSCLQACMDLASASRAACDFSSTPQAERLELQRRAAASLGNAERQLTEGSLCGCLAATDAVRQRVAPMVAFIQRNLAEMQAAERAAEKARRDRYELEQKAAAAAAAWQKQQAGIKETRARAIALRNSAEEWTTANGESARKEAEQKVRTALAMVPGEAGALLTLARLTADPAESAASYAQIVAAKIGGGNDALLALAYRGLGRYTEAANAASRALANPRYSGMRVGLTAIVRESEVVRSGGIDVFTKDQRRQLVSDLRRESGNGIYDSEYSALKKLDGPQRLARLRPLMLKVSSKLQQAAAFKTETVAPCESGSVIECHDALYDGIGTSLPIADSAFWTLAKGACIEGSLPACSRASGHYEFPAKPLTKLPESVGYLADACEGSIAGCRLLGVWLGQAELRGAHLKSGTPVAEWRARAYRIACQMPQENSLLQTLCETDGEWRDMRPAELVKQGVWPLWYQIYFPETGSLSESQ